MAIETGVIRGKTAIVGVGTTRQGEHPGRSADEIAVDAIALALADAGIDKSEIDGLITCKTVEGQGIDTEVGRLLGIDPAYAATLDYGTCNFSLHLAVMAIVTGLAKTIAIVYGTNQRTSRLRFGGPMPGSGGDFSAPYGFLHVAGPLAMSFRRRQHLYGTTEEQLGHVAVTQREYAQLNPLSIFTAPLTIEDYLATDYIVEPLRRHDLTMMSDGGAALIVTAADRVNAFQTKPAYVLGMAQHAALYSCELEGNVLRPWMRNAASRLYESADVDRSDVDILYIQDPVSVYVLEMLETYGFCAPGEAGPFVAEGNTRLHGSLPLNTNGGQLSEAYMWGWLHLCEAVRQLRGECGARQIRGAEMAQYSSTMGLQKAAATILASHT